MPANDASNAKLETLAARIEAEGGTAWLLELPAKRPATEERMRCAFDRSEAYVELESAAAALRSGLARLDEPAARRRLRQVERGSRRAAPPILDCRELKATVV